MFIPTGFDSLELIDQLDVERKYRAIFNIPKDEFIDF